MKFLDWKLLKESLSKDYLNKEAEKIKTAISKFREVYVFPDFETFKRPGEPEQQSNLFTDDKLNTFSVNYTLKGEPYSIDFWKPTSIEPMITYYVKSGNIEEIADAIPTILDNPERRFDRNKVKISRAKVLQENLDLEAQKPKKEVSLDPVVKKANAQFQDDFDYGDPETIFEDLKVYVDMVIKGIQPSLLVTGSPGVGKTYSITDQIKKAGLIKDKDFVHIKGRSTAAGMYITLYENNGKLIIFDDCDSIWKYEDAVNILKGALDSYGERSISWLVGKPLKLSDGSNAPKSFDFTGRVIFISNLPQRKIDDAVKSRSFVLEVALTPEDMIKKMHKELPNIHIEVPLAYKTEALDLIESAADDAKNLEISMRTLVKAIKILKVIDDLSLAKRLILQQCSYK
jgi:hypothetical protein